jgi:hypothetical protein
VAGDALMTAYLVSASEGYDGGPVLACPKPETACPGELDGLHKGQHTYYCGCNGTEMVPVEFPADLLICQDVPCRFKDRGLSLWCYKGHLYCRGTHSGPHESCGGSGRVRGVLWKARADEAKLDVQWWRWKLRLSSVVRLDPPITQWQPLGPNGAPSLEDGTPLASEPSCVPSGEWTVAPQALTEQTEEQTT